MIPILYEGDVTTFRDDGLSRLDFTVCEVTEERNGEFELYAEYPIGGDALNLLTHSRIIYAKLKPLRSGTDRFEPFRIYKVTKPIRGVVKVYARHISYELNYIPVSPFPPTSSLGLDMAFLRIQQNVRETCRFSLVPMGTFPNVAFENPLPNSVRALLGGIRGSILDTFGGEYMFFGTNVYLYDQRGIKIDTPIYYGVNLIDLEQEQNIENTYTGIMPYYDDGAVSVISNVIARRGSSNYPYPRSIVMDMTSYFDEPPSLVRLFNFTLDYLENNKPYEPRINIQTKVIPELVNANLCDTIDIIFEKYDIKKEAKITKIVWDVLKEEYKSLQLGDARSTLSNTIYDQQQEIISDRIKNSKVYTNTVNIDTHGGTLHMQKNGYMTTLKMEDLGTMQQIPAGTSTIYLNGIVPADYRPLTNLRVYGKTGGNQRGDASIMYNISTDGTISFYPYYNMVSGAFYVSYFS